MKFGVFYEHQIPRPWHEHSEYEHFQNALTQIEIADQAGYDYAWQVEHHFLEEYSHGSSPTAFLAAASQRTKNIRLGHGVFQLTSFLQKIKHFLQMTVEVFDLANIIHHVISSNRVVR